MPVEVLIGPKAYKPIRRLDKATKEQVKKALKALEKNPKKGKHLKHSKYHSLRIGVNRAVYEFEGGKVVVLYFGHRSTEYEDLSKII